MSCFGFLFLLTYILFIILFFGIGLVESDPEGALAGFAEVVRMEPEKAEWSVVILCVENHILFYNYYLVS